MKNLFDFATKELSQDAFICWLVNNYDNDNNIELKRLAYDFINFISKKNYKIGDIKYLNTLQQANNMDVIIDIWETEKDFKDKYSSDYVIVIEDKTTSSAHKNQLINYGDEVRKWNKKHSLVFYKTNLLSDTDNVELDKDKEWISYDIHDIYDFFKERKVNDEIVDFYIDHIAEIHKDLTSLNTNSEEWNFFNYYYFIDNVIRKEYAKHFVEIKNTRYQGKYVYTSFYFKTNHKVRDWKNNICLEIKFRPENDTFNATIHPEFKYGNKYSWKILDKEEFVEENIEYKKFRNQLLDLINNSKSKHFKTYKKINCVGIVRKENKINRIQDYESLKRNFEELIDDFINIFKNKI